MATLKKILLVQPRIGHMDAMRTSPTPPLGLIHAASRLVGRFNVEILDARMTAILITSCRGD